MRARNRCCDMRAATCGPRNFWSDFKEVRYTFVVTAVGLGHEDNISWTRSWWKTRSWNGRKRNCSTPTQPHRPARRIIQSQRRTVKIQQRRQHQLTTLVHNNNNNNKSKFLLLLTRRRRQACSYTLLYFTSSTKLKLLLATSSGEEDHARPGWTTSRRGQDSP